jgi:hypothetical protein
MFAKLALLFNAIRHFRKAYSLGYPTCIVIAWVLRKRPMEELMHIEDIVILPQKLGIPMPQKENATDEQASKHEP